MIGGGYSFQVSGLGRREPGSGVQVRVQVQDLNFTPYPNLYLITRTRDLRAETWDPTVFHGRADHPWSAAVEQGCSTLPKTERFSGLGSRPSGDRFRCSGSGTGSGS